MEFASFLADGLKIPVRRAAVEIRTESSRRSAVLFMPTDSGIEDVFEDPLPFLAAESEGRFCVYARAAIVSLVVDAPAARAATDDDFGVAHEIRTVAVHLRNGELVTGTLHSMSRQERTLDLVNGSARSLAIHVDGCVHHIAKAHIAHIEEVR